MWLLLFFVPKYFSTTSNTPKQKACYTIWPNDHMKIKTLMPGNYTQQVIKKIIKNVRNYFENSRMGQKCHGGIGFGPIFWYFWTDFLTFMVQKFWTQIIFWCFWTLFLRFLESSKFSGIFLFTRNHENISKSILMICWTCTCWL